MREEEIPGGGQQNQSEKAPVPAAIKEVTGREQQPVLAPMRESPVERPHRQEEHPEEKAVEQHDAQFPRRLFAP